MDLNTSIQRALQRITEREEEAVKARDVDAWNVADDILGRPGAMISGSKTAPEGQLVVWNSNVCTKEHRKIWFGDLNITKREDALKELAKTLGVRVYILREMDARFDNELKPRFENAVAYVDPDGTLFEVL